MQVHLKKQLKTMAFLHDDDSESEKVAYIAISHATWSIFDVSTIRWTSKHHLLSFMGRETTLQHHAPNINWWLF